MAGFVLFHLTAEKPGETLRGSVSERSWSPARVTRIIDGDTIDVSLDGATERIRVLGLDAPELSPRECYGRESQAKLEELIGGKDVQLIPQTSGDNRDRFGRLLRYISFNNTDIGLLMIAQGYAQSYEQYPHELLTDYEYTEKTAQTQLVGLWGTCTQAAIASSAAPTTGDCVIKGNVNADQKKTFHLPGCGSYNVTKIKSEEGDRLFCTEAEAQNAGFVRAGNC